MKNPSKAETGFTAQEFRDRIARQCGFPLQLEERTYPPGSYGEWLSRTGRKDNRQAWDNFLAEALHAAGTADTTPESERKAIGEYFDRMMSDPNRQDRIDDAKLDAELEERRVFDAEDIEDWQRASERQGAE